MGLIEEYLNFFDKNIEKFNLEKTKMLELGDQTGPIPSGTGKAYYMSKEFEHISVDLNGKNESIIKDLRYPEEFTQWVNYFNIITNSGTSEHVEPLEYQYDCFSILHDCLKVGGIQLHVVPSVEGLQNWGGHCTVYYSMKFFNMLAQENNYEIVEMKMSSNNLLMVCLRKKENTSFMNNKTIFLENLHYVPQNLILDGDSSSNIK